MKVIISIILSLFISSVYANSPNRILDKDYLLLIQSNSSLMLSDLLIYKSTNFEGDFSFKINSKGVLINNSELLSIADSKKCADKIIRCKGFPGFIKSWGNLYLEISDYKNGIARLDDGKNSYYVFIKKEMFTNKMWPEDSLWKVLKGESAKEKFLPSIKDTQLFKSFISQAHECILNKDLKCLNRYAKLHTSLEKLLKYRELADSQYCTEFLKAEGDIDEELLDQMIVKFKPNESKRIWRNLQSLFEFKEKYEVEISTVEFDQYKNFKLILDSKEALLCENTTDLEVSFSLQTNPPQWIISDVVTYKRNKPDSGD